MILAYVRTVILYVVLIASVRIMGKRQIGQMEPTEFVVAMLIADLAAVPMQDGAIPLLSGIVPLLTVLGLELTVSFLVMKSLALRRCLCGRPVILIDNGRVLQDNLRRTRVTIEELMSHLRQKDVLDLSSVQYAILETDGNLSVFPYPKEMPASARDAGIQVRKQCLPVTIIADGEVLKQNLPLLNKDMAWVKRVLQQHDADVKGTYLLTVDKQDHIHFIRKEV